MKPCRLGLCGGLVALHTRVIQDKYEVLGRIGEGTFGEVHRARSLRTGELVAIKRVRLRDTEAGGT